MFTIDNIQWNVPCQIDRVAELRASEISGMLLNKNYFNDVIGTFLTYSITLALPFGKENLYAQLYEILTDPVDAHTIVVPYNQGNITITGRVDQVKDTYIRRSGGRNYWMGITFSFISNSPTKTHTLGQAITRGISPLPDIAGAPEGALYQFDGTQWVESEFADADDIAY